MRRGSAVVAGLLHDGLGLGEAARGYADALAAAGWDVRQLHVDLPSRVGRQVGDPGPEGRSSVPDASEQDPVDLLVLCLNPPEVAELLAVGAPLPPARRLVGVWAWETEPAPADWVRHAGRFDELWCYSTYVERVLRPVARTVGIPLFVLPPPVRVAGAPALASDHDGFFLCVADVASSLRRKNPGGVIDAFVAAFPDRDGPRLVVKTWGGGADPAGLAALRSSIEDLDRPDITLVDEWLERRRFLDLLGSARAFVSLHRSEGLGLPIFEAMALGVPVVAAASTGPMDLLDDEVALLVPAAPAPVTDAGDAYGDGGRWFEPSPVEAARRLRELWDDPEAAGARAHRARRRIDERLSVQAVGQILDAHLRSAATATPHRAVRATTVSVVLHAAEPWPAVREVYEELRQQATEIGGNLIVGVRDEACLPAEAIAPGVVRVVVHSRSPFRLRAAALAAADGALLVVTEDHAWPRPGWLRAYWQAYVRTGAPLLAGPIVNGSPTSRMDWANYLVNFVAFAPPLAEAPSGRCPTIANCAVSRDAFDGARAGRPPEPEWFERQLVPHLHHTVGATIVPDAVAEHAQHFPWWRHLANHVADCRCAGAHDAQLWPEAVLPLRYGPLRQRATDTLHDVTNAVSTRPALHDVHRHAAWGLRLLAASRALAIAAGARWGAGRAAEHLD